MHIHLKGEITMEQAMSEMRAHPERVFWLAFVRGTGKERGTVKVVAKCQYGAPKAAAAGSSGGESSGPQRKKALHVDKGTLPMTDYETGDYLTPLISHLIGFNMKKIIH